MRLATTLLLAAGLLVLAAPVQADDGLESDPIPPLVDTGGECSAWIHLGCNHYTALGTCAVFIGGPVQHCLAYGDN